MRLAIGSASSAAGRCGEQFTVRAPVSVRGRRATTLGCFRLFRAVPPTATTREGQRCLCGRTAHRMTPWSAARRSRAVRLLFDGRRTRRQDAAVWRNAHRTCRRPAWVSLWRRRRRGWDNASNDFGGNSSVPISTKSRGTRSRKSPVGQHRARLAQVVVRRRERGASFLSIRKPRAARLA
jgi:hypothetical protein